MIEVEFTDAEGIAHTVVDKLPVFASAACELHPASSYPTPCHIELDLVDHRENGRCEIDLRWSESTTGRVRFVVRAVDIEP
ncbi:hypothetical protein [Nocardia asteroides]|uniref:hypothetical protein n=1 Tax=Nocardia asteroides TaxID=1824 RepID=UPI001E414903|nr:hypothetical protein [Nocardia asteroides]UGT58004.1 hypothetical protein LTT85_14700 [Nocardia asteroides]